MRYLFAFLLCAVLFSACSDCSTSISDDKTTIVEYLDQNNLTASSTTEGVYYSIDVPGSAEKPNSNSQVTVAYRGYLLDGTEFDASGADDLVIQLWQVIEGWTIGIPQFGRGGSGTLYIPSALAYDCDERTGIPANSILAFDITLVDFQ